MKKQYHSSSSLPPVIMRLSIIIIILHCCLLHLHQSVAGHDDEKRASSSSTSSISSSSWRIEILPGYNNGTLPFELYTGYIGVPQNQGFQQLFYYFVKSQSNPKEDPIILWLTGGPGCSSLTGLLYELGPLEFEAKEYDGSLPTLLLAPHSITKVANVIYLDQPARSGFSYATSPSAAHSTDLESCNHVYQFLKKWFSKHPDFRSNRFYVGGDSYSGITVPIISQLISDGNAAHNWTMTINLKGYILGNAKTFPKETNYTIPFAHGMGLISNELYKSLAENCKEGHEERNNELCSQSIKVFTEKTEGINTEHILEPLCGHEYALQNPAAASSEKRRRILQSHYNLHRRHRFSCRVDYNRLSNYWANDLAIQEALHVRKGSIGQWQRCRQSITSTTYEMNILDTRQYHANLSRRGYASLIYSGDHDMVVPFQSTEAWIKSLNYTIIDDWRQWTVNDQVAGYTRSYSNGMTFATVKGAGHVAFAYKREECVAMLTRWLSHHPL